MQFTKMLLNLIMITYYLKLYYRSTISHIFLYSLYLAFNNFDILIVYFSLLKLVLVDKIILNMEFYLIASTPIQFPDSLPYALSLTDFMDCWAIL